MFIAPATEAFYLRDPIALKPLQTNSSELAFPPKDLVTVSIRFTKVLYAQLKSQQFEPPVAWKEILNQTANETGETDKRYIQLEMGMKVTSGFEMFVTDPKNGDSRVVRELKILLEDLAAGNESDLPTNEEIAKWNDVAREDDESWLDINFEDFERELRGKGKDKSKPGAPDSFSPEPPSGFGDAKTQADLKKMVERFEAFLNDDEAGIDGAEMDDTDRDDDEDEDDEDDEDEDSEDEDKDVSFDEKEFARMMREMMGMPPDEDDVEDASNEARKVEEVDTSDEENSQMDEARKIRKVMERMEAELNEAGALDLDPTPKKLSALRGKSKMAPKSVEEEGYEEDSDAEVDIDFNLAKNLLESFKSQAGMAGPGGNLMGLMGLQLPRDEDDAQSTSKKT